MSEFIRQQRQQYDDNDDKYNYNVLLVVVDY